MSAVHQARRLIAIPAHWHQVNFRPYKPLPRDVSYQQPVRSTPILRTVIEFFLGILCLGIPFLFADRARYNGHFDVEGSHLPESTTPLFVIGGCACLVVRFPSIVFRPCAYRVTVPVCDHPQCLGYAYFFPWVGQHRADRRSRRHHVLRFEHGLLFRLHLPLQS